MKSPLMNGMPAMLKVVAQKSHLIEIGGSDTRVTKGPNIAIAEIVAKNHDEIRLLRSISLRDNGHLGNHE